MEDQDCQWDNTCLTCMRHWDQFPAPEKGRARKDQWWVNTARGARLLRAWKGGSLAQARLAGQDVTSATKKGLYSRSPYSVTTLKFFSFSNILSYFSEISQSLESLIKEPLFLRELHVKKRKAATGGTSSRKETTLRRFELGPWFSFHFGSGPRRSWPWPRKGGFAAMLEMGWWGKGWCYLLTSLPAKKRSVCRDQKEDR